MASFIESKRVSMGGAVRVKQNLSSPSTSSVDYRDRQNIEYSGEVRSNNQSPTGDQTKRRRSGMTTETYSGKPAYAAGVDENIANKSCRSDLASIVVDKQIDIPNVTSVSHNKPWTVNDFVLGKPLGKGKFGNVYAAKQRRTNTAIALKVLFKAPLQSANCVHLLRREVELQYRLKHPNIVQLYGYFHDAKNIYLLLEHLGQGELFKHMQKQGGFVTESVSRGYMRDIASAIYHMHNRHVYHRDLKPENILISDDGRLKIADFGWAAHAPPPNSMRYTVCGTPEYLAPEMITESGHNGSVDIWAMGVLLFELTFGRTPFYEKSRSLDQLLSDDKSADEAKFQQQLRTYERIKDHDGRLEFPVVEGTIAPLSKEGQHTILALLHPSPSMRMTPLQLLEGKWMSQK